MKPIFTLLTLMLFSFQSRADMRLPAVIGNNMVLQQQAPFRLWGWAAPNETVVVECSWMPLDTFRTQPDRSTLQWALDIPVPAADLKKHSIRIRCGWSDQRLENVVFGEVWLCSGQSNMEWQPAWGNVDVSEDQYRAADDSLLRFFTVPRMSMPEPQQDCEGAWKPSNRDNMHHFSCTAYFFGRELRDRLGVPVGLVNASWGGTPIESWMHPGALAEWPLNDVIDGNHPVYNFGHAGSLYNGMIAPLKSVHFKGILWYQGETNTHNPARYAQLLEHMAGQWRTDFGAELPFYYVQIAPWKYGAPRIGAEVRYQQLLALRKIPRSGMVVISDIGDINDIHPRNKTGVGKRLAAWALAQTYGQTGLNISGPLYRDHSIEKDRVSIRFDHAEGLSVRGERPDWFEIAGEDRVFYPAEVRIERDTVVVSSPKVKQPVAVRFAYDNIAEPNLVNGAGLPASCFRTDNW